MAREPRRLFPATESSKTFTISTLEMDFKVITLIQVNLLALCECSRLTPGQQCAFPSLYPKQSRTLSRSIEKKAACPSKTKTQLQRGNQTLGVGRSGALQDQRTENPEGSSNTAPATAGSDERGGRGRSHLPPNISGDRVNSEVFTQDKGERGTAACRLFYRMTENVAESRRVWKPMGPVNQDAEKHGTETAAPKGHGDMN
ncbi:hypothetical protein H920_12635 [Fukomys damarensis]|uniref:Uncharacterized protein n=1 Tax=Fukomys damarensis TaxID=885580 RepID=A0A091DT42_FUKDA|nr:hypothetical protein H920_12635 [Fukomys damarensis]